MWLTVDKRYAGFDYLRCLAIIGVVTIHCAAFRTDTVIYQNILLLCVPVFLLMSLFLFGLRLGKEDDRQYFVQRITRVGWLYVFWVTIWVVYFGPAAWIKHDSASSIAEWFATGAYSPFYFLVTLFLLTCLSYLCRTWPSWVLWVLLGLSFIPLPFLRHMPGLSIALVCFAFLPLGFIAALIVRSRNYSHLILLSIAGLGLIAAIVEWQVGNIGYAKPSIMGFSAAALLLAFKVERPAPQVIVLLADCSLGIYAIHMIVLDLFQHTVGAPNIIWGYPIEIGAVLGMSLLVVLGAKRALQYKML